MFGGSEGVADVIGLNESHEPCHTAVGGTSNGRPILQLQPRAPNFEEEGKRRKGEGGCCGMSRREEQLDGLEISRLVLLHKVPTKSCFWLCQFLSLLLHHCTARLDRNCGCDLRTMKVREENRTS